MGAMPWEMDWGKKKEQAPWERDWSGSAATTPVPQPLPGSTPRLRAAVGAPEHEPLPGATERLRTATGAPDIPEDPRARFGKIVTDEVVPGFGETIKGSTLGMLPQSEGDVATLAFAPSAYLGKKMVVDPAIEMERRSRDASSNVEKLGYLGAAVLPLAGPAAADVGEKLGRGEVGRVVGNLGAMAAMGGVAKGLGRVAARRAEGAPVRESIRLQEAHENIGKPLFISVTRRGVGDPKYGADVTKSLGGILDELAQGQGVEAGKKMLRDAVPRERFDVLANAAERRAQRIIGPVKQQIELHGDRLINTEALTAEIKPPSNPVVRAEFPEVVSKIEAMNARLRQGPITLREGYEAVTMFNEMLDTIAKKQPGEFSRIVRNDPDWGHIVQAKESLRNQVFKDLPEWTLEQFQEYGATAHIRDSLRAAATKNEAWVSPDITGPPSWMQKAKGLGIAGIGALQGRMGTTAYGASRMINLPTASPFELLAKAVDNMKVSAPKTLQGAVADPRWGGNEIVGRGESAEPLEAAPAYSGSPRRNPRIGDPGPGRDLVERPQPMPERAPQNFSRYDREFPGGLQLGQIPRNRGPQPLRQDLAEPAWPIGLADEIEASSPGTPLNIGKMERSPITPSAPIGKPIEPQLLQGTLTSGRIPATTPALTPGQRLAEQVRQQRLGRTARPELAISERRMLSPAESEAARLSEIRAKRDRFLREHGARPMTNLGRR